MDTKTNPNTPTLRPLLTASFYSGLSSSRVKVNWDTEGEVTVSKCDNAIFQNGSFLPGSGLGEREGFGNGFGDDDSDNIDELVIAPNPSSSVFTVDAPMDSTMDIYDSQGRSWHQGEVQYGERLQIDASNWPAGIYFCPYHRKQHPKNSTFYQTLKTRTLDILRIDLSQFPTYLH